jgi:hypothetical protein
MDAARGLNSPFPMLIDDSPREFGPIMPGPESVLESSGISVDGNSEGFIERYLLWCRLEGQPGQTRS